MTQQPSHRRSDLAKAAQEAVKEAGPRRSGPAAAPPPRGVISQTVLALLLAAVLAWFIVSPPAWLRGPEASAERVEASGRLALYLQARRIEQFRADSGHLPADLGPVGAILPGIQYRLTGEGGYRLILDRPRLIYYSAASPESFLGNAMDVLNQKGGK
jgi:hypothetical protein